MTHHSARRAAARLAMAAIATVAVLELVLLILAPEDGPLGVLQIFAPHLAIAAFVVSPLVLLARGRAASVAFATLLLVTVARFGGDWLSLPAAAGGSIRLEVATWNLEVDSRPGAATAALLTATSADVIGLQELQPGAAAAIEADPALRARFPYRVLHPRDSVLGLGLVSRFPLSEESFHLDPAIQEATITLDDGRRVAIVNTHPLHAEIATISRFQVPIGLDVVARNADLVTIRRVLDGLARGGVPAVLLGDLNTAATEPAFARLVRGLRDVHGEVGLGSGWTWRPRALEFLGLGLLRIDHVIATPDLVPLGIGETCPDVGDHCLVHAALAIPGG